VGFTGSIIVSFVRKDSILDQKLLTNQKKMIILPKIKALTLLFLLLLTCVSFHVHAQKTKFKVIAFYTAKNDQAHISA
jgi:hypothetical protein